MSKDAEPCVDFREYVCLPGTRTMVRRITGGKDLALTYDAIGVRAKTPGNDVTYPWGVISQATDVPRAK